MEHGSDAPNQACSSPDCCFRYRCPTSCRQPPCPPSQSYPDGIKRDAKGNFWIGHYSAGQLVVVDPEGKLLGTLEVPSAAAPNLAFSADGSTVYVMAVDDTANAPYLGKVYAVVNPWP